MAVDHNNPQSRDEEILIATIDGTEYNKLPQSRMEELLLELKETIEQGGGGGGTSDYENLTNQPQVNGETLIGDKTGADLGLVDAEEGKVLSTNDYDNNEKAAVAAATSAISAMKDGTDIDSFGDVEVALLDKADISDLGTAAAKDSTNAVTSGSTNLVESGAVKDAIDAAVSSAYHHAGTKTVAQLTHDLLVAANEGNVYNITDSGTTTSDFIEGIGKTIDEGSNVGICKVGNVYMFDLLSGFVDTTNFVQKSQTSGLLKNDGTVNDEIEGDVDTLKDDVNAIDSKIDDSTTYPYASSITIEDAIPANLADCKVKIEPVQDLHGYDHPWVGGAGLNKYSVLIGADAFDNNSGATHLNDNGTLVINCTSTGGSGVYTNLSAVLRGLIGDYTGDITYSFDVKASKANTNLSIGFDNDGGRRTETVGTSWQRWTTTATADGTDKHFIAYNYSSDDVEVQIKNFMFETGSVAHDYQPYTNICPISGHTEVDVQRDGVNLVEGTIENCNINSTGLLVSESNYNVSYGRVFANKQYTISSDDAAGAVYAFYTDVPIKTSVSYDGNRTASNNKTFTAPIDGYVAFRTSSSYTHAQLELGSTATTYEPYAGKTYTIALGSTIYGGTVDFDSGVMTVDRAECVFDGSEDEGWTANYGLMKVVANDALYQAGQKTMIANSLESLNDTVSWANVTKGKITISKDGNNTIILANHNTAEGVDETLSEFKAWLAESPLQICYYLATPTTIQLTPQRIQLLKGHNTLTASTGQISVTVNGVSGSIGQVQEQVNELAEDVADAQSSLAKLHYHKVAESAATGTRADKLASLYTTYNTLQNDVRKTAILVRNNADIFHAVNNGGAFSSVYLDISTTVITGISLNPGSFVANINGTTTDGSSTENTEVYSLWIIE